MAGMDRNTGRALSGWAHVEQSIGDLLSTALGSRVMRRTYGSALPRLIDAPMTPARMIDFYASFAGAIDKFEPRFKVSQMAVDQADTGPGKLTFTYEGTYYPRGHLGDFSIAIPQAASVPLPQLLASFAA